MFGYIIYKIGAALAPIFPLWISYFIADISGELVFFLSARKRGLARISLERIGVEGRTQKQKAWIARKRFRLFSRHVVHILRLGKWDRTLVESRIEIAGREILDRELRKGKGAIILSAHFNSWEVGAAALAASGYPVTAVVQKHSSERVTRFYREIRERSGIGVVDVEEVHKRIKDILAANRCLLALGDRDLTGKGKEAHLFGYQVRMPSGLFALAYKHGCCVIPGFIYDLIEERFRIEIHDPIILNKENPLKIEVQRALETWIKILEHRIKGNPECWFVFDPVWLDTAR
jgi:KDO2-lipid IV(A) lauroyltransferase